LTFYTPWLALLLVPATLGFAAVFVTSLRLAQRGRLRTLTTLRFALTDALRLLPPSPAVRLRPWVLSLRILVLAALGMALMRPQVVRPGPKVWARGVDILLAVDTSGSMQALDLDPERPIAQRRTRLQVVKDVLKRFIERRPNDQLGLVAFGSEAFTQCPLTLDHEIVDTLLERMHIGMAGETTAIGSGITTGLNRLRRSTARSKVMVLLTDGSNNAGQTSPKRAAELAAAVGIKVYTVGAAHRGPAPILQDSVFGKSVQYIQSDLDETTLREVAQTTGGHYFRAEDGQALEKIYSEIDRLEKSELHRPAPMKQDERFAPWVWLALELLGMELALLRTRLRTLP
jgi:Ca-activated chloride channel family protein